jgi:signal transduction histidine kinase
MVSLRARAASIGAEVRLLSADPGTILEVVLPLPEETT